MTLAPNSSPPNNEGNPPRHIYDLPSFWPVAVFLLTLATHGFYICETASHPFFSYPLVDSHTYHEEAQNILQRGWLGDKIFWQAPLYPYFLAVCYTLIDRIRDLFSAEPATFFDVRFIQAVLAAINGVLLYTLGRRCIGRSVAIGAAIAAALYGPLIYFDTEMLAPVLVVLFYLLMALALEAALRGGAAAWWPAAGVSNGLAVLSHGLALLIAPLVCLAGLFGRQVRPVAFGKRFLAAALFAVGVAAMIAPVTIRNRMVGGEWVLVSHNGPINFYIGNHPEYDKMVGLRPGLEWMTLLRDLNEHGIDSVSAEARYFAGATLANFRERPRAVVRVWLKKVRLLFHAGEIKRNYPIYPVRDYSNLMWLVLWKWRGPGGLIGLGFPFGIILPLAVVGWWALRRRGIRMTAVELIIAGHVASNLMFFICSRYRVPLAPFLLLYAAAAVDWAIGERIWRTASLRKNWRPPAVAVAVFLAANAALTPMDNDADRGEYRFYLGLVAHRHQNRPLDALDHYQAALRLQPDYYEAHSMLGILYCDVLGEPQKALEQFQWLLDRDPGNMQVLFNKSVALANLGRNEEALAILEELVAADSENREYRKLFDRLSEKTTAPQSGNRTRKSDEAKSQGIQTGGPRQ